MAKPAKKQWFNLYTTSQAAELIGISRDTILRVIRNKKIDDVDKDYKGARQFTDKDIRRFREFFVNQNRKKLKGA